jgi:Txe/YoeB family toxin of Txe-Axe toxin-antitoxin module
MFIYPVNVFKIIQGDDLSKYIQKEDNKLSFNTKDGIYEIINDKIYKYNEAPETTMYDFSKEHKFRIQHEHHTKHEVYYIPIHYTYKKTSVKKYKLVPNSLLTLVVEDNITFYFETKETEITHSVKEDMITFLSVLKLYK